MKPAKDLAKSLLEDPEPGELEALTKDLEWFQRDAYRSGLLRAADICKSNHDLFPRGYTGSPQTLTSRMLAELIEAEAKRIT